MFLKLTVSTIILCYASLLSGCAGIHSNYKSPSKGPTAEVLFSSGNKEGYRVSLFESENCSNHKNGVMINDTTAPVRFLVGKRIFIQPIVLANYHYCQPMFSFVPEDGKSYNIKVTIKEKIDSIGEMWGRKWPCKVTVNQVSVKNNKQYWMQAPSLETVTKVCNPYKMF